MTIATRKFRSLLPILMAGLLLFSAAASSAKPRRPLNDAHLHYVDFLQQTDGIEVLLQRMDEAGVEHAMINGLGVMKKWDAVEPRQPHYYLSDDAPAYWYSASDVIVARAVLGLKKKDRARFHPFICAINPTDLNAINHIRLMIKLYPGLWQGIGEILTRHDDLTALTYGETARANHPALDAVYEFAAEHNMPVSIHANITSISVHEPLYLPEVEDAVRRHPKTRFIFAHAGMTRRVEVPTLVHDIRRMVETYPNLSVDLSWVVYPECVAPKGVPNPDWVQLVSDFPDRFMIGTDKIGHFDDYYETIRRYDVFLDALPPKAARMVAAENFLNILPKTGVTLETP